LTTQLVVLTGPIGAGKSSVAELVSRRVAWTGLTAAVADLDDVAFMQRGRIDLEEFWRRAGITHCALVRSWFAVGVDVVVAHGPFFESRSYDELFATAPGDATVLHVLLRVSYEEAVARVTSDTERGATAISRDPEFLRSTHSAFRERESALPRVHLEIDTTDLALEVIAERVVARVFEDPP